MYIYIYIGLQSSASYIPGSQVMNPHSSYKPKSAKPRHLPLISLRDLSDCILVFQPISKLKCGPHLSPTFDPGDAEQEIWFHGGFASPCGRGDKNPPLQCPVKEWVKNRTPKPDHRAGTRAAGGGGHPTEKQVFHDTNLFPSASVFGEHPSTCFQAETLGMSN